MQRRFLFIVTLTILSVGPGLRTSAAQDSVAPCGVVNAIDFPIDELVPGYDDFALFRRRFGGRHTGIDIGFNRWGDEVRAAARGRVTYSDPEGWDTEKGVVIVEHSLPDGSLVYSVYGHMEQTDTLFFPAVGQCVEQGDILGGIGWPSRGLPHLHFEMRSFLPDDGGPGYVDNPLQEGWYHPFDFTHLWNARLTGAIISHTTFANASSLPPVTLDSGMYAIASGNFVSGATANGDVLWRVEADSVVIGLAPLAGGRVVAQTRSGQAMTLQNGRFLALWAVNGPNIPFVTLGEQLIFATSSGLVAYDPLGNVLWERQNEDDGQRILNLEANGSQIALGTQAGRDVTWEILDTSGQTIFNDTFDTAPLVTPDHNGGWRILHDTQLEQIQGAQRQLLAELERRPSRLSRMTVGADGNSYIYYGGSHNQLIAVGPQGSLRWQIEYPNESASIAPLLESGNGCLLYSLDADGMLNVFDAADGELRKQLALYPGGSQTGNPRARVLQVDSAEQVRVASGFLTTLLLDGSKLGEKPCAAAG